jgi:hypothetical protein
MKEAKIIKGNLELKEKALNALETVLEKIRESNKEEWLDLPLSVFYRNDDGFIVDISDCESEKSVLEIQFAWGGPAYGFILNLENKGITFLYLDWFTNLELDVSHDKEIQEFVDYINDFAMSIC